MREIRRNGWIYAEQELGRIRQWLVEKEKLDNDERKEHGMLSDKSEADLKRSIFLEQLKSGVMKSYYEQVLMERQLKEEAKEAKALALAIRDQEERERIEKVGSSLFLLSHVCLRSSDVDISFITRK